MDDLDADRTLLDSLKLSSREATTRARKHWADARRELADATKALRKVRDAPKAPDAAPEREGVSQDVNAVIALSAQIDATTQDLVKGPKTQEGFQTVGDTASNLLPQFDTIKPPEAVDDLARAKDAFTLGIATIAPLALGKEEALKQAQKDLNSIADRLSALVGDAAPAPDVAPGEDDKEPDLPPGPAPSVNPLPPPPPPPRPQ